MGHSRESGWVVIGVEAIHGFSNIGNALQRIHVVTCTCISVGGESVLILVPKYISRAMCVQSTCS